VLWDRRALDAAFSQLFETLAETDETREPWRAVA
jgi:hypothetical protein